MFVAGHFVTCFFLFSSLQRAPVLEAWVGLRPGRPSTRIEKEVMKFKDEVGRERSLKVSRRTLSLNTRYMINK